MQKVFPLIGYMSVSLGHFDSGLLPIVRSLLLSGQIPLYLRQFLFRLAIVLRGSNLLPIGRCDKILESPVYANRLVGLWLLCYRVFAQKGD